MITRSNVAIWTLSLDLGAFLGAVFSHAYFGGVFVIAVATIIGTILLFAVDE